MAADKFSAVWVSHSSLSDFLVCPRAYFLKNVYKDPKSKRKIQVITPPLALGQAVHEVIESLSTLPTDQRLSESLLAKFDRAWQNVSGKKGGFSSADSERHYKERGKAMLRRVAENPGPIAKSAVKIKEDLPQFWLSEEEGIRLCGKIDWLEYQEDTDSVHIIDFKTGKNSENPNSLQLAIYYLLVHYCQKRKVSGASYWYLETSDVLEDKPLPDLVEAQEAVLKVAKQMKLARQLERFKCPNGDDGCRACRPYEAILRGAAEFVGSGNFGKDVYMLTTEDVGEGESVVL